MIPCLSTTIEDGAKSIPEIIRAAAESPLGIFALMIISLSVLSFVFFKKAHQYVQLVIFLCLFGGVVAFGITLVKEANQAPNPRSNASVAGEDKTTPSDGRSPTPSSSATIWSPSVGGVDARPYYDRGYNYYNIGEYDKAIREITEAIQIKPDNAPSYYSRGSAYNYKGEYDNAIRDFTEAIRLQPDYADAYHNRGLSYQYKGQASDAKADFAKADQLRKAGN